MLTAVGLMPEIQLARDAGADYSAGHLKLDQAGRTSLPWLFACGNAAKIFPIVDDVSLSSEKIIEDILKHE